MKYHDIVGLSWISVTVACCMLCAVFMVFAEWRLAWLSFGVAVSGCATSAAILDAERQGAKAAVRLFEGPEKER